LLESRKLLEVDYIYTIAGTGSGSYSGDGGLATSAELDYPRNVAIDTTSGDVYIADEYNNRIRLITKSSGNNYIIHITIKLYFIYIIIIYLSMYVFFIYIYIYIYFYLSLCIYLFSIYLFIYLSIYLVIYLSI
jgi:hypothetical protein